MRNKAKVVKISSPASGGLIYGPANPKRKKKKKERDEVLFLFFLSFSFK